jgi:glycosyltransferase involved in cell wall biosynthesis
VLFVGRLLPFKGVSMLLQAFAALPFPARLTIIGEGSERAALEKEAAGYRLEDRVQFTGNRPLAEIAAALQIAHVFCLPSVRESGGAVLLEAMAAARPVIAIDFGGPAEIVDAGVGVKLPPTGRTDVVQGLIAALTDVVQHPEHWAALGMEGRLRVERRYGWDAKIETALGMYREILEQAS